MEYFTADSYKGWEIIKQFEENGKMYADVKNVCSKCGGKGIAISHVENGIPIPYLPDDGMCYSCMGQGYFYKKVRLYTKAEYEKMTAINEANRIKKAEAQEKKMKEEFETKRLEWLQKENFTPEGKTYIVTGDSYSIKDILKGAGFRFSQILKWHRATPGDFKCIEIDINEIAEASAWGDYHFRPEAKDYIQEKIDAAEPKPKSEWVGEEKTKITDMPMTLKNIHGYTNAYGYGKIYTFETKEGNIVKWFTTSNPAIAEGDMLLVSATIKEHSEYKGEKQTIISRPKFKGGEL